MTTPFVFQPIPPRPPPTLEEIQEKSYRLVDDREQYHIFNDEIVPRIEGNGNEKERYARQYGDYHSHKEYYPVKDGVPFFLKDESKLWYYAKDSSNNEIYPEDESGNLFVIATNNIPKFTIGELNSSINVTHLDSKVVIENEGEYYIAKPNSPGALYIAAMTGENDTVYNLFKDAGLITTEPFTKHPRLYKQKNIIFKRNDYYFIIENGKEQRVDFDSKYRMRRYIIQNEEETRQYFDIDKLGNQLFYDNPDHKLYYLKCDFDKRHYIIGTTDFYTITYGWNNHINIVHLNMFFRPCRTSGSGAGCPYISREFTQSIDESGNIINKINNRTYFMITAPEQLGFFEYMKSGDKKKYKRFFNVTLENGGAHPRDYITAVEDGELDESPSDTEEDIFDE